MRSTQTTSDSTAGQDLEALFWPRSIAIVGASANEHSQGYEYVEGLIKIGFPGPLYPVNPKLDELLGLKVYPRLEDIPGPVDFVISAVPASATLDLVEGAKAKGTKLIHFYTGRFSETGREDAAEAERELARRTREAGIRVIGPNCMGVYYPKAKVTFDPEFTGQPGNIGFLTQSGSHAYRVLGRGRERGLQFSKVISYGNALDLNEADFLDHFAADPDTEIIAAYIEGVRDGRRFYQALRRAADRKPVVLLKGGRTSAGHAAASSHTASLASQRVVWQAAVSQAGALEVNSLNELIDMLVAFRNAGPVNGRRVGVLGGAGGGTVEAADLCQEAGLELPPLPQNIREALKEKVPHAWDWVGNPVDSSILGRGVFDATNIIEMMADSPTYDAIIANVHVEWILTRPDGEKIFRDTIERFKRMGVGASKATMLVMGEPESREEERRMKVLKAREELGVSGAAVYPNMDRAIQTMGRYVRYMAERQARSSGQD
ncbi:MAG: CoA-binding protein [Dehalococcoidia bacterium]